MIDPLSAGAMVGGGLVVGFWNHIRGFANQVLGLFIVTVTASGNMELSLSALLWAKFKRMSPCHRVYDSWFIYRKSAGKMVSVVSENHSKVTTLVWRGWRPMLVTMASDKDSNTPSSTKTLEVRFIRGTFDADALMLEADKEYHHNPERQKERFAISTVRGMSRHMAGHGTSLQAGPPKTKVDTSGVNPCVRWVGVDNMSDLGFYAPKEGTAFLALAPDVAAECENLKSWVNSRDWYATHQVPWRRGYVLHGQPGNGKSTLSKALAYQLGIPLVSFDLSTLTNAEFADAWQCVVDHAPGIVLMEDFDNIFHGRENVVEGSELSFDTVLNCISGVGNGEGVITIITTNHVELLDPALGSAGDVSSRPGRIDKFLELVAPSAAGRELIAKRILCDNPELIQDAVVQTHGMSGAQVQEVITNIALKARKATA